MKTPADILDAQKQCRAMRNQEEQISWWYLEGYRDILLGQPIWEDYPTGLWEVDEPYMLGRLDAAGDLALADAD